MESSIIIPLIILSIIALIYIGLLLHERALIQAAADRAAEMGSAAWLDPTADIDTGKSAKSASQERDLYRRILYPDRGKRLEDIEAYAGSLLSGKSLLHSDYTSIKADMRDYAVYKKLEVTVERSFSLPAGKLLRIFGGDGRLDIRVTACSVVDDPEELIRNTDFIIDLERELEERYPGLKNLGEKTRGAMNDLKGRISGFLD